MERRVETVSLRDFLEWEAAQDQKHELSHGRIIVFSGESKDHNHIGGNVYIALTAGLRPPCTAYGSDMIVETIQRKADNGYRTDVVVSCSREDEAGDGRFLKHPRIVVEVRSPPTNVGRDWEGKLLEYWSTPSIEQVVIIESESRALSSYCRDEHGTWQPPVTTIGNGTFRFSTVDVKMTLDEVYRRTTFDIER